MQRGHWMHTPLHPYPRSIIQNTHNVAIMATIPPAEPARACIAESLTMFGIQVLRSRRAGLFGRGETTAETVASRPSWWFGANLSPVTFATLPPTAMVGMHSSATGQRAESAATKLQRSTAS